MGNGYLKDSEEHMVTCKRPMTGAIGKSRSKINDDVDSSKFLVNEFYASIYN
jgi:hypothetical protein